MAARPPIGGPGRPAPGRIRRARLATALALGLLAGAQSLGCRSDGARPAPPAGAPSILLISIDTLRADRVGAYGARFGATPAIDGLAAQGLRCEKAISPAPITLPSHATLLTGLYPPRHGVRHNGIFRLADEHVTLAERLRDAGWATGAVVGALVLERRFGLDQGFDFYDDQFGSDRANPGGFPERPAAAVTDAALGWLERTPGPFFLFLHYYDPHADYAPPSPWNARFAGRPYEGEIASVDAAVGRLLERLRADGRFDDTLVVVTADHGESLGEHGERTHSYTLYDATLSVPLVLRGPGVPAGATLPGVVSTASVAPTLLRLAGLPAEPGLDGEDLTQRWSAPNAGAGEAYAETLATQLDHGWAPLHALRTPAFHFVRAPRPELYDAAADPKELRNLLDGGRPPEADLLDGRIAAHLERGLPLRTAPLDGETLARLRALGYALPDGPVAQTGIDPKDGLPQVEIYVDARNALFAGDLDAAERKARELLAASPASGQAEKLLAGVEQKRGNLPAALAHLERAASLVPESAPFLTEVGDLKLELDDVAGAVAAYEAALARDPGFPWAHAGAMWRAHLSGDAADAVAHAERAVALRPDDAQLRLRIARAWDRFAEPERALAAYREALRLDAGLQAAHMGVAIQLARLGRDGEVAEALTAAGPYAQDSNYRSRLAIAYAARGESERAEALFREILAAHPEHPGARRNLAHLLRKTGRGGEAERLESEARGGAELPPQAAR